MNVYNIIEKGKRVCICIMYVYERTYLYMCMQVCIY